jgi:hypothetical protein
MGVYGEGGLWLVRHNCRSEVRIANYSHCWAGRCGLIQSGVESADSLSQRADLQAFIEVVLANPTKHTALPGVQGLVCFSLLANGFKSRYQQGKSMACNCDLDSRTVETCAKARCRIDPDTPAQGAETLVRNAPLAVSAFEWQRVATKLYAQGVNDRQLVGRCQPSWPFLSLPP